MKIFLSYAYTGEDHDAVVGRMRRIHDTIQSQGVAVYCNAFDPDIEKFSAWGEFMRDAVKKMQGYDTLLIINTSERRSEGMLGEMGAALARGMKILLAQHISSVDKTSLPTIADQAFVWQDEDELLEKITALIRSYDV